MSWFEHETQFVKALKQKLLHPSVKHNIWVKVGFPALSAKTMKHTNNGRRLYSDMGYDRCDDV